MPWAGACWVFNAATGALLINGCPGRKPAVTIQFDMETTDADFQKDAIKPSLWQDRASVRVTWRKQHQQRWPVL